MTPKDRYLTDGLDILVEHLTATYNRFKSRGTFDDYVTEGVRGIVEVASAMVTIQAYTDEDFEESAARFDAELYPDLTSPVEEIL